MVRETAIKGMGEIVKNNKKLGEKVCQVLMDLMKNRGKDRQLLLGVLCDIIKMDVEKYLPIVIHVMQDVEEINDNIQISLC